MNMNKCTRTALLLLALSILCFSLIGCSAKQDNSVQALETKKIAESFIQSYNNGDADACINLLKSDIIMEQTTLETIIYQDSRFIIETFKNNIALNHNWKVIEYLHNSENSITIRIEETGEDVKLAGIDFIGSEITFEVKDGKIAKIITVIDKKSVEQIAKNMNGGIGVGIDIKPDRVVITSVVANSPAEKVGLKQGDEIIEIDGIKCSDMKQGEQLVRIRGLVGSKILLKIRYSDTQETFIIELIRADISKLPSK